MPICHLHRQDLQVSKRSKGIPKSHRLTQLETKLLNAVQKLLNDDVLLLKSLVKYRKLSTDIQELPDEQVGTLRITGGSRSSAGG